MRILPLLITGIVFVFAGTTSAQEVTPDKKSEIDRNKEAYEQIFRKEIGLEVFPAPNYQHLLDLIPAYLPNWVFQGISNHPDTLWAIGISNPAMPPEQALLQAQLRAKALIALAHKARLQYISDDFGKLAEDGRLQDISAKYQDFSLLNAELDFNANAFHCAQTFRTKYDETIVRMGFTQQRDLPDTTRLKVTVERLNVYIETTEGVEKITTSRMLINETGTTDNLTDEVVTERYNKGLTRTHRWNDSLLPVFDRKTHYISDIPLPDSSNMHTTDAVYGIWLGVLENMAHQVSIRATHMPSIVKNTSDFYTTQNDYLVRTLASNCIRFQLENWWLQKNDIAIRIVTENIQNLLPGSKGEKEKSKKNANISEETQ